MFFQHLLPCSVLATCPLLWLRKGSRGSWLGAWHSFFWCSTIWATPWWFALQINIARLMILAMPSPANDAQRHSALRWEGGHGYFGTRLASINAVNMTTLTHASSSQITTSQNCSGTCIRLLWAPRKVKLSLQYTEECRLSAVHWSQIPHNWNILMFGPMTTLEHDCPFPFSIPIHSKGWTFFWLIKLHISSTHSLMLMHNTPQRSKLHFKVTALFTAEAWAQTLVVASSRAIPCTPNAAEQKWVEDISWELLDQNSWHQA